jgi:hypothetical protein
MVCVANGFALCRFCFCVRLCIVESRGLCIVESAPADSRPPPLFSPNGGSFQVAMADCDPPFRKKWQCSGAVRDVFLCGRGGMACFAKRFAGCRLFSVCVSRACLRVCGSGSRRQPPPSPFLSQMAGLFREQRHLRPTSWEKKAPARLGPPSHSRPQSPGPLPPPNTQAPPRPKAPNPPPTPKPPEGSRRPKSKGRGAIFQTAGRS